MPLETFPFDSAQYLTEPEDQLDLLTAALASGQASIVTAALGMVARARGLSRVAQEAGVTPEALDRALGPEGDPQLSTLLGVMRALGVRLTADAAA